MAALWTTTEQQTIKKISDNNINRVFDKLSEETQALDLLKLLGFYFYQDLIQNPTENKYTAILNSGTWTSSDGNTYQYKGLKYVLAYFFYARYLDSTGFEDTFSGMKIMNNPESKDLSNGDIKNTIREARQLAFKYWEELEMFLRENTSTYEFYKCDNKKFFNSGNFTYF